jgi:hypothetical protein
VINNNPKNRIMEDLKTFVNQETPEEETPTPEEGTPEEGEGETSAE